MDTVSKTRMSRWVGVWVSSANILHCSDIENQRVKALKKERLGLRLGIS